MSFSVPTVNGFVFCARFSCFSHDDDKLPCSLHHLSLYYCSSDPRGGNVHLVPFPSTSPTASVVIPAVLGGKTLLLPRSQSSVILPAQVNSAAPVLGPLPVAPIGTWQPNVLSLADALPVSKLLISISGQSFHLPIQSEDVF